VAAAEEEIDRLTIRAPFRNAEFDSAELGALLQPGALCATVIRLDPIRLVGFVPETDVDKIEVGAHGRCAPGQRARSDGPGKLVARSADPATRTFRVEVRWPTPIWRSATARPPRSPSRRRHRGASGARLGADAGRCRPAGAAAGG
jgi:membrane fusion protein, multidrug efflux system